MERICSRLLCVPPASSDRAILDTYFDRERAALTPVVDAEDDRAAEGTSGNVLSRNLTQAQIPKLDEIIEDQEGGLTSQLEILKEFSRVFTMFLFFMQKLGLITLENVDFGLWGDIFGWISFMSVNIDIEFEDDEADVIVLFASYLAPVFLIALYHQTYDMYIASIWVDNWYSIYARSYILKSLLSFIVLGIGISVAILSDALVGTLIGIASGYSLLFYLFALLNFRKYNSEITTGIRKGLRDYAKRYIDQAIEIDILLIKLSFTPVASVWARLSLVNPNDRIAYPGTIIGALLIGYMLLFLTGLENPFNYSECMLPINRIWMKMVFFNEKKFSYRKGAKLPQNPKNLNSHIFQYISPNVTFRKEFWWFEQFLLVESVIIVLLVNLLGEGADDDIKIVDLSNAVAAVTTIACFTIVIYFILPYRTTRDNRIDLVPRLGNIILGTLGIVNSLVDPEEEQTRNLIAGLMLSDSFLLTIFWIYHLKPLSVIPVLLKQKKKDASDSLEKLMAEKRWKNVKTLEQVAEIVLNSPDQTVNENTWSILYPPQRLLTLCVKRDNEPEEFDEETNVFLTKEDYPLLGAKYGFAAYKNVKRFTMENCGLSTTDLKSLSECEDFINLGFDDLNLSGCQIEAEGCEFLIQAFTAAATPIKTLGWVNCSLGEEGAAIIANYLSHKECPVVSLTLEQNPIGNNGAKAIFEGLMENKTLDFLILTMCELDDEIVEPFLELIENNKSLKYVFLASNALSVDAVERLQKAGSARDPPLPLNLGAQEPKLE